MYEEERDRMVTDQIANRGVSDNRVLKAFREVPRHEFVPEGERARAYLDSPLPIGEGQTISQPYMVAKMTELLELEPDNKVLEIGAGSGYQAAILCELAEKLIAVERLPELAKKAAETLEMLGYDNFEMVEGDGTEGYDEEAPYDAIMVTAAAPGVPAPLKEQLKDGGRLVIPVGSKRSQKLLRVTRNGDSFETEELFGCRFVPLVGKHGWD